MIKLPDVGFIVDLLDLLPISPYFLKMQIQSTAILITMSARPEKRKELCQTLHSIVGQVRKQLGCLHAGAYQNTENENDSLVLEEWDTRQNSDAHLKSDIFTILMGAGSMMFRPPKVVIRTHG